MKVLEEKEFSRKEIISTNIELQKLDDLDLLRKQPHPWLFTTSGSVTSFTENEAEGKKRTNEYILRSVFKEALANHFRKKLLYSICNAMGKI